MSQRFAPSTMASTQQAQLPQTAQVREMENYINNSDFQQVI